MPLLPSAHTTRGRYPAALSAASASAQMSGSMSTVVTSWSRHRRRRDRRAVVGAVGHQRDIRVDRALPRAGIGRPIQERIVGVPDLVRNVVGARDRPERLHPSGKMTSKAVRSSIAVTVVFTGGSGAGRSWCRAAETEPEPPGASPAMTDVLPTSPVVAPNPDTTATPARAPDRPAGHGGLAASRRPAEDHRPRPGPYLTVGRTLVPARATPPGRMRGLRGLGIRQAGRAQERGDLPGGAVEAVGKVPQGPPPLPR